MPVQFVKGDLFAYPGLQAFAHGCNCAGAMGKGIAVEFRRRYPLMYTEYKRRCRDGLFRPGDVFTWTEGGVVVFNLGTQKSWRTGAELPAVEKALTGMCSAASELGVRRIGLPRIGAGLGRLPWDLVRTCLGRVGASTTLALIVFEEYAAS
jgi:O-acetyl-ADP-ribose deacetylase (regulator of RNase III)